MRHLVPADLALELAAPRCKVAAAGPEGRAALAGCLKTLK
jgi:hypothetical protein